MAGQESAVQKCSVCEVETNVDLIRDYNRHYCRDSNEDLPLLLQKYPQNNYIEKDYNYNYDDKIQIYIHV